MINVRLYGVIRVDTGIRELSVDASSVRELLPTVAAELARLAPEKAPTERELRACLVTVNGKAANYRAKLHDGDTVNLIPAAAGG